MIRFAPLSFLVVLAAAGCGSREVKPLDEETMVAVNHFQKIATAYNQVYQTKGKPPTSANDLKPFLKQEGEGKDPLISPNDGQPIVIVPGVAMDVRPPSDDQQSIVAYDRTGVNGKRMLVDVRGTIQIVTDKEFAQIKFVGGHKPK